MTNTLKIAAVGGLAALGLASAAVAQQKQMPNMSAQQHQQMTSGGTQNGQMMGMMTDSKMGQGMMQMMKDCNHMMQQSGNMPDAKAAPKS